MAWERKYGQYLVSPGKEGEVDGVPGLFLQKVNYTNTHTHTQYALVI